MSKLLIILLLIALPLSWTATVAAAYCNHETVPSEQNHLGHHQANDETTSILKDVDNSTDGSTACHTNCSFTHSLCSAIPTSGAITYFSVTPQRGWLADTSPRWSDFASKPERPKWPFTV